MELSGGESARELGAKVGALLRMVTEAGGDAESGYRELLAHERALLVTLREEVERQKAMRLAALPKSEAVLEMELEAMRVQAAQVEERQQRMVWELTRQARREREQLGRSHEEQLREVQREADAAREAAQEVGMGVGVGVGWVGPCSILAAVGKLGSAKRYSVREEGEVRR